MVIPHFIATEFRGFKKTLDRESHVCRLKRALYGLKQPPHAWYTRIESYFTRLGFTKSEVNTNLYHIVVDVKILIIVLYVYDLILTSDEQLITSCKEDLAREFEMKDMGTCIISLAWKYGKEMGSYFYLRESIARRF